MQKNDEFIIDIIDVTSDGSGIGEGYSHYGVCALENQDGDNG